MVERRRDGHGGLRAGTVEQSRQRAAPPGPEDRADDPDERRPSSRDAPGAGSPGRRGQPSSVASAGESRSVIVFFWCQ
ncbi:hypothetical protein GCM10023203_06110 [Actinomycetospora straminea]|uniref:Uncharacterized protein n=1 Tax=Actinomycetospora straminea TaxID=663607 RepID=A0ABP9DZT1_9PSEU